MIENIENDDSMDVSRRQLLIVELLQCMMDSSIEANEEGCAFDDCAKKFHLSDTSGIEKCMGSELSDDQNSEKILQNQTDIVFSFNHSVPRKLSKESLIYLRTTLCEHPFETPIFACTSYGILKDLKRNVAETEKQFFQILVVLVAILISLIFCLLVICCKKSNESHANPKVAYKEIVLKH